MKLSEILNEIDQSPISTHQMAAHIVGYLNSALQLIGDAVIGPETTGAAAIAAIYKAPRETQDEVFAKDFTPLRKKDSYKVTVLGLSGLAVFAGLGFAGTVAKLEGQAADGFFDVFKVLISGLFEIAKLVLST
uniref:Virion structural protein n=1 Tax=Pseudomonas phage RVTF4 TaxID=3236931 RepID=A0AB39CDA0_9VIRU